uniref:ARAD1B06402p n=1 Tax=Blastobotrys adeninivorans TaxID=409370 RepID=A0A060T5T9_BLAAD
MDVSSSSPSPALLKPRFAKSPLADPSKSSPAARREVKSRKFQEHVRKRRELRDLQRRGGLENIERQADRQELANKYRELEKEAEELFPLDALIQQAETVEANDYCHGGEGWAQEEISEQDMLEYMLEQDRLEMEALVEELELSSGNQMDTV